MIVRPVDSPVLALADMFQLDIAPAQRKTLSDLVPDLVAAGFGAGSPGNVTFISATQGWICAYGVGLWHTSDGVHWSALGV